MRLVATIDGTERTPLMEGSSVTLRRPVSTAKLVLDDPTTAITTPSNLDAVTIKIANDIIYSESFGTSTPWIRYEATPVATLEKDPIWGLRQVSSIVEDATTDQHYINQRYLGDTNSEDVVLSAYLKGNGCAKARLLILQRDHTTTQWVEITFSTGAITDDGSGSSSVEDVGNDWYRVAIIGDTGTGSNDAQAYLQLEDGTSYLGDGSSGVLAWGFQWQSGETTLAPYNPTVEKSTIFDGFIRAKKLSRNGGPDGRSIELDCVDWTWRLANPPALCTKVYADQTDQDIIIDAASECGLDTDLTVTSSTIDSIETGLTVAFDGATLREVLDEMVNVSGGQWWLDNRTLYYSTTASTSNAAWAANSDDPSIPASWDVENLTHTLRHDFPINSVEVVGPVFEGERASATDSDATSISAIGTYARKIEVKTATTDGYATKIAEQLVDSGKDERSAVSFQFTDDLGRLPLTSLGRIMNVKCSQLDMSSVATFLIREIQIKQRNSPDSRFTITAGDYRPSTTDTLARLEAAAKSGSALPATIGALDFDSASSEHVISTSSSLTNMDITTDLSLFATVRVDDITGDRTIFAHDDNANKGLTFGVTSFGLIYLIRTRASSNYTYSRTFPGGGFVAGNVYRIVAVSDITTGTRFWINGVEATTGGTQSVGSGSFDPAASSNAYVGRDDGGAYMDGAIGGVAYWSVALPETTAAGLHNSRFSALPFPNYLEMAWALDEFDVGSSASGTGTIIDRSTNAYDGTPTNTPTGAELVYLTL